MKWIWWIRKYSNIFQLKIVCCINSGKKLTKKQFKKKLSKLTLYNAPNACYLNVDKTTLIYVRWTKPQLPKCFDFLDYFSRLWLIKQKQLVNTPFSLRSMFQHTSLQTFLAWNPFLYLFFAITMPYVSTKFNVAYLNLYFLCPCQFEMNWIFCLLQVPWWWYT